MRFSKGGSRNEATKNNITKKIKAKYGIKRQSK
jgi:hypothetical protein